MNFHVVLVENVACMTISRRAADLGTIGLQFDHCTTSHERMPGYSMFNIFKRRRPAGKRKELDILCNQYPDPLLPFGILDTKWDHFVLNRESGLRSLDENRLTDPFIDFVADKIGGFIGKSVLELGPYEGFHTYRFCKMGAEKVVSIEGNPRNFLKCLIVKNHYQLNTAQFLLGDFLKYLKRTDVRFDFILAAGVLYHSAYPISLLNQITAKSNTVGICTTLYHPDKLSFNMTGQTREVSIEGTQPFKLYQRENTNDWTKNSKSGLDYCAWLISEEDLLRFLDFRGFEVEIFRKGIYEERSSHRIRLLATKRNP